MFLKQLVTPRLRILTTVSLKNLDSKFSNIKIAPYTRDESEINALSPNERYQEYMNKVISQIYYIRYMNIENIEEFQVKFLVTSDEVESLGITRSLGLALEALKEFQINRDDLCLLFLELSNLYLWFKSFRFQKTDKVSPLMLLTEQAKQMVKYLMFEVLPVFPFAEERELNLIIQINNFMKRVLIGFSGFMFTLEEQMRFFNVYFQLINSPKLEHVFISSFEQNNIVIIYFCKNLFKAFRRQHYLLRDYPKLSSTSEYVPVPSNKSEIYKSREIFEIFGFYKYFNNFIEIMLRKEGLSSIDDPEQTLFQRVSIISHFLEMFECLEKIYYFTNNEFVNEFLVFQSLLQQVPVDQVDMRTVIRIISVIVSFQPPNTDSLQIINSLLVSLKLRLESTFIILLNIL